jgi:hypothetical protein
MLFIGFPQVKGLLVAGQLATYFPFLRTSEVVSDFLPGGLPLRFGVYCFRPSSERCAIVDRYLVQSGTDTLPDVLRISERGQSQSMR